MADTGLLVTLAFADKNITNESVYRSVLRGNIGINEGMLVENLVAQMLVATGHKLFFYSQSGHKEGEERMEIDFLITRPYADAAGKPRISLESELEHNMSCTRNRCTLKMTGYIYPCIWAGVYKLCIRNT